MPVMPLMPQLSRILAIALALPVFAGMLAGCGQKGPLFIPNTPPAAERATLPQTVFGQPARPASAPAAPASAPRTTTPPSALPNLPETQ
ncbi:MAG: lipoprotein [Ottowia sp.]|uniref:LPS translocon maturation chaperone LptM n=1 Tax=unclassified Ottowia TaxID=2645081 RepID=UPI003C302FD9